MVEQGFYNHIQTGVAGVQGFFMELPKDFVTASNPQAWVYRGLFSKPLYSLNSQNALTFWNVQIDCHGYTAANALTLAHNITDVLSGSFAGTFTDADSTVVKGIFRQPPTIDGFDDTNRTFVRSLEYQIQYYEQ